MSDKSYFKWAYLENIALVCLAGFVCWLFHSGWGLLVLMFCNTEKRKEAHDERNT